MRWEAVSHTVQTKGLLQVRQPGMTLLQVAHTVLFVSTYPLSHGHVLPDWVLKALIGHIVQFVAELVQEEQLGLQGWHWITPES